MIISEALSGPEDIDLQERKRLDIDAPVSACMLGLLCIVRRVHILSEHVPHN